MNNLTTFNKLSPSKKEKLIEKFLEVWKQEKVHDNYSFSHSLPDDEYIIYNAWCQLNDERLYTSLRPNMSICSGSMNRTDKIIFHGGCQSCDSQEKHGINRCKGCQYFQANWKKPDLSNEVEEVLIPPHTPEKSTFFKRLLGISK